MSDTNYFEAKLTFFRHMYDSLKLLSYVTIPRQLDKNGGATHCAQMGLLVADLVLWHGRSSRLLLLRQVGDQSLRGEDHSSNTGRILKSGTGYLGRIGNTGFEHILVLVGQYVVTEVLVVALFL